MAVSKVEMRDREREEMCPLLEYLNRSNISSDQNPTGAGR